jgi:multicomponent Na+:H+ antiporter subunit G
MSVAHTLAVTCFGAGVAIVVLTGLGALRVRRVEDRLHYVTPATALGVPLSGLGLVIANGWGLTSAQIVLVCVLMVVTGPVLTSAALRVAGQHAGTVSRESPE